MLGTTAQPLGGGLEPYLSRTGRTIQFSAQPFHTSTDPDRGQQSAGDRPNDHVHAKTKVLRRESFESAPLAELAEAEDAANCRADKKVDGHGCVVSCLVPHDQEDRAHDRAEIHHYGDELEVDEHKFGYGFAGIESGDAGIGETGDDETQEND